jgi:hypothetical protein
MADPKKQRKLITGRVAPQPELPKVPLGRETQSEYAMRVHAPYAWTGSMVLRNARSADRDNRDPDDRPTLALTAVPPGLGSLIRQD